MCQISTKNCQPPKKFGKRNAASEKLKNHKSSHLLTGFSGGLRRMGNGSNRLKHYSNPYNNIFSRQKCVLSTAIVVIRGETMHHHQNQKFQRYAHI